MKDETMSTKDAVFAIAVLVVGAACLWFGGYLTGREHEVVFARRDGTVIFRAPMKGDARFLVDDTMSVTQTPEQARQ